MLNERLPRGRTIIAAVITGVATVSGGFAQQNHQVAGTVTSTEMAPLAGVSVTVQGTNIGTITNATGNFSLQARSAADTLVISSIGFRPQEIAIAGRRARTRPHEPPLVRVPRPGAGR